jgi:hypothetical protein
VLEGSQSQALNHRLRAKYLDDIAIELTPQRWRSWTGAVLHAETQKELDGPYGEAWRD